MDGQGLFRLTHIFVQPGLVLNWISLLNLVDLVDLIMTACTLYCGEAQLLRGIMLNAV